MMPMGIGSRWRGVVLAGALATASGCVSCLRPVAPPPDTAAMCAALPEACRNRVFVFLIDGPDPIDLANLGGMRDALISLGFIKTYHGECWHSGYFKDEIRRIHREDESARFVLMGFGPGAGAASNLAESVLPDGVPIDLLVACDGAFGNGPVKQPANVTRVLHIVAKGGAAPAPDGAEEVECPETTYYGSPNLSSALPRLAAELAETAGRVPVIDLRPVAAPEPGEAPPRAAPTRETLPHDEWDFLKPDLPYVRPAPREEPAEMPKAP